MKLGNFREQKQNESKADYFKAAVIDIAEQMNFTSELAKLKTTIFAVIQKAKDDVEGFLSDCYEVISAFMNGRKIPEPIDVYRDVEELHAWRYGRLFDMGQ